jgi:hypothetical protein
MFTSTKEHHMTEATKPIHNLRLGYLQAAIWSNPGTHGEFFNVTFTRRYRDGGDDWQSSDSFGRDDLLLLAKLADAAHTWICERMQNERSSNRQLGEAGNAKLDAAARKGR